MVERRDQVLITRFSPFSFIWRIFFSRLSSQKGPFFNDLPICLPSLLQTLFAPPYDVLIRFLPLFAGPITQSRLTPRGNRSRHANGCFAFPASVGVIRRVHNHSAHSGPSAQPAGTAGFTDGDVLVVQVAHLTNGGPAIQVD